MLSSSEKPLGVTCRREVHSTSSYSSSRRSSNLSAPSTRFCTRSSRRRSEIASATFSDADARRRNSRRRPRRLGPQQLGTAAARPRRPVPSRLRASNDLCRLLTLTFGTVQKTSVLTKVFVHSSSLFVNSDELSLKFRYYYRYGALRYGRGSCLNCYFHITARVFLMKIRFVYN